MNESLSQTETQQLIQLIQNTYQSSETQTIKSSESLVLNAFSTHPSTINTVFSFICPQSTMDYHFQLSCANLIKAYYYKISHQKQIVDKFVFVNSAYQYLLETIGKKQVKETIATSLEHILNEDHENMYKGKLSQDVVKKLQAIHYEEWNLNTIMKLDGLMLVAITCLNSFVEIEDICEYVLNVYQHITSILSLSLSLIEQKTNNEEVPKNIFDGLQRGFTFLSIALERIEAEEEDVPEVFKKIITSDSLKNAILGYLHFYNEEGSVLTKYTNLNKVKEEIVEILYVSFKCKPIPRQLLQLLLFTFLRSCSLKNSQQRNEDEHSEQIICRCMQILQNNLKQKQHYELFIQFKIQIIFALLMYSVTEADEEEMIISSPEKFVELAEDYSQFNCASTVLKVRASCLLKTFISFIDEGKKIILELVIIFMTSSIGTNEDDTQMLKEIKQQFTKYQFWGLTPKNKLDVSMMVLTAIAFEVKADPQYCKMVDSIFMAFFSHFVTVTDPLLLLRLIRLVGYYPASIYFSFVRELMGRGRVYVLEGLLAFSKIANNEKYRQKFPMIEKVFLDLVDYIDVGDLILEELIEVHYEHILHKNEVLFARIVQKLKDVFTRERNNTHKILTSLKHFEELIYKEKQEKYLNFLVQNIEEVYAMAKDIQLLQENFISINLTLVKKKLTIHQFTQKFMKDFISQDRLCGTFRGSKLFLLVNKYLVRSDSDFTIEKIYNQFTLFLMTLKENHNKSDIVSMVSFILGQIIVTNVSIPLNMEIIENLLILIQKTQEEEEVNRWLVLLFLHYLYRYTTNLRQYLFRSNRYYSVMLFIFRTKFLSLLQRKIVVITLSSMMKGLADDLLKETVRFCCNVLYEQHSIYMEKPKIAPRLQKKETRMRRIMAFEEQKNKNKDSQEETDPKLIEDYQSFKDFSHSFKKICEFENFKRAVFSIERIKEIMDRNDMQRLKEVMYIEWHKENTRKIVKLVRKI